MFQAPFCPPKPIPPEVNLAPSTYEDNIKSLWASLDHTDVCLVAGNYSYSAHRCFLAAASHAFYELFTMELIHEYTPRSSSDSSMVSSFGEATVGEFNEDTECLIRIDQSKPNK